MKTIFIKKYECEYCGKVFDKKFQCSCHELLIHICPNCKYSYYVYGCELNCELNCELKNEGKRCSFKERIK